MMMNTAQFNPSELSSRKLWQLVNTAHEQSLDVSEQELKQAVAELAARRHYLAELQQLGELRERKAGI